MSNVIESRVISSDSIRRSILVLRGQTVLLDRELSKLYSVKPIALRQQVRRNRERFPEDFMFQLSAEEVGLLVSQSVIPSLKHLGGSRPLAFTQEGVAMLSSVLRSAQAVRVNIAVMRAFVKLREILVSTEDLAKQLNDLELRLTRKLETHDQAIVGIFKTLRELMNPPKLNAIGFTADLSGRPKRGVL